MHGKGVSHLAPFHLHAAIEKKNERGWTSEVAIRKPKRVNPPLEAWRDEALIRFVSAARGSWRKLWAFNCLLISRPAGAFCLALCNSRCLGAVCPSIRHLRTTATGQTHLEDTHAKSDSLRRPDRGKKQEGRGIILAFILKRVL